MVIKVREISQDAMARELAIEKNHLEQAQAALDEISEATEAALGGIRVHQKGNGTPGELTVYYQFLKHQVERVQFQQKTIEAIKERCELKRRKLEMITQEKKMLEKIESKRREAFSVARKKKERDFLDEVAGRMKGKLR